MISAQTIPFVQLSVLPYAIVRHMLYMLLPIYTHMLPMGKVYFILNYRFLIFSYVLNLSTYALPCKMTSRPYAIDIYYMLPILVKGYFNIFISH